MSKHDEPIELADDFEHTLAALLAVPPKGSEEPSSALDVAAALIEMRPGPDQMQLHKLLYLVQAAHLAWYGSPAFRERIEAWRWGPMVRRVAGHYKGHGRYPIAQPQGSDPGRLAPRTRKVVERVVQRFGHLDGPTLAAITKVAGGPWHQVWGDRGPEDSSQEEIPLTLIADYHRTHDLAPSQPTPDEAQAIRRYLDGDTGAFVEMLGSSLGS